MVNDAAGRRGRPSPGSTACAPTRRSPPRNGTLLRTCDRVSRAALIRSPIGRGSMGTAGHRAFDVSLAGELDAVARLREIRKALGAWACTLLISYWFATCPGPRLVDITAAIRKPLARRWDRTVHNPAQRDRTVRNAAQRDRTAVRKSRVSQGHCRACRPQKR
jgi:hypothetical protein